MLAWLMCDKPELEFGCLLLKRRIYGEMETCRKCNGAYRFIKVQAIPTSQGVEDATYSGFSE
jgi:hypothetical protein